MPETTITVISYPPEGLDDVQPKKGIFLPNEYCQWEFLTGLSVLCAAHTWGKITNTRAALQLWAGLPAAGFM